LALSQGSAAGVEQFELAVSASAASASAASASAASASALAADDDDVSSQGSSFNLAYYLAFNNDTGDRGDSDKEGEEVDIHMEAAIQRTQARIDSAREAVDDAAEATGQVEGVLTDSNLTIPVPPPNYQPPLHREDRGEPAFSSVDNPGDWPEFTYRQVFKKDPKATGKDKNVPKYSHHALPTGCRPVPADASGHRAMNGWDFYYHGDYYCKFYDKEFPEPFKYKSEDGDANPEDFNGVLDVEALKELSLTSKRMEEGDPIFFLNLLLPIGDPQKE